MWAMLVWSSVIKKDPPTTAAPLTHSSHCHTPCLQELDVTGNYLDAQVPSSWASLTAITVRGHMWCALSPLRWHMRVIKAWVGLCIPYALWSHYHLSYLISAGPFHVHMPPRPSRSSPDVHVPFTSLLSLSHPLPPPHRASRSYLRGAAPLPAPLPPLPQGANHLHHHLQRQQRPLPTLTLTASNSQTDQFTAKANAL